MPMRPRASAVAVLATALFAGLLVLLPGTASAAPSDVFISELHYDDSTSSGDVGEGIEIQGPVGESVEGWRIVLYNGNGNAPYGTDKVLTGTIPASGVVAVSYPTNGIQNGDPDGVALVDAQGGLQEFISYDGAMTGATGPAAGVAADVLPVAETNSTPPGTSLQKVDGVWKPSAPQSFGTKNTAVVVPPDPDGTCTGTGITHTIAQVQGTTTSVAGAVKVTGIVTADHRTGGYNGAFIQTAGTGGAGRPVDATTASDGIFVYFGTDSTKFPTIAVGDRVEVSGTATEFNGLTQITTATKAATAVCESGVALPAATPLALPLDGAERESVESMLVAPTGPATVSEVYNTNRFGEVVLAAGDEPAPIPTDLFAPGTPEAVAQKAANAEGRILLDDGKTTNLASAGLAPPYLSAAAPLRVGDAVAAYGPLVLSYGFDDWRLQPTTPVAADTPPANRTTFTATNPRTAAPAEVGGDVKVGSFNVLNYFVHYGGNARGAANEAARLKQEAKIVAAIRGLGADVLALEEIENSIKFESDPARSQLALQTLVAALNTAEGAGTWDYVRRPAELPGAASEDVITTAIIFKPAVVTPVGDPASINDESVWFNAREPIAQTFESGDATFTVVANHLKSKSAGDDPPTGNDNEDVDDGQGAWNGDRLRQVASLVGFVETVKAESGSDDVLMFGDFNAYTQEDPMRALYDEGYLDVASEFPTGRHSYVFGGEEGSLDHAVASPSMADRITGFDIWEINAHESFAFQYDGFGAFYAADPYRASDHNPELVGIDTSDAGPTEPVELQLLGINDFHGRIEATPPTAGPPPEPRTIGGAAQLAGLLDQQRALNPNTAFVSAGDNIGASTFVSAVDDDNPTIDVLNAMGLDVSAVGNHEFDQGFADLDGRVQDRADFPYLGANVYFKDGSGRALDPYVIKQLGGLDVAYVGVVTGETPSLVSPDGISALEFRDPAAEATAVADDLKDGDPSNGEADVVVLLAHEGAGDGDDDSIVDADDLLASEAFADFVDITASVDAVFSGHTHQQYALLLPKPGGGTRPFVQTGEYGKKLGKITISVDPETLEVSDPTATLLDVADITPVNAEVKAIVDAAKTNSTTLGAEVIGTTTTDIKRDPNRATESVLANFIADVQLESTKDAGRGGAQIALMNPGGVRADIAAGEVTYAEAFAVQSFSNDVFTKTYTGAQLKQVLEQQWQPAGAQRPFLALGISKGFTFSSNPLAANGNHIIPSSMKLDGVTIDPAGTYRVTVNSFLAAGGDNFTVLGGGTNRTTPGDNDLTMLVDHFRANSPVTADPVKRTSTKAELQILSINDFHGRIEATPPTAGPPPEPRTIGGAAQLAGLADKLRLDNPLTSFVANGDNIGASTFVSAVDDDNPTIDVLNAMGLDVSSVGNHEFDQGFADLDGRVQDRADFPYLGANVYFKDGSGRALDPYFIKQEGSVKVGYIGVVTSETPSLVSPDGISTLEFRDPVAEATAVAAQLKDGDATNGEADVIVLLAHEGASPGADTAAELEADEAFGDFVDLPASIDAIFSGHTHQEYAVAVPVPGGGTRPIVQTGEYGKKLGKVTLTLDPTTKDVTGSTQQLLDVADITPVNAEVKAIVDAAKTNSTTLGAEVIGTTTTDIKRDPNRATESVLANFIADVQLESTRAPGRGGAQIALMNPGGVRADIAAGEVTYAEAFAVQSFSNDVFTKTYTGAQLKAVLEQQWQPAGAQRPVLALGISKGFTFEYVPTNAQGDRIVASTMKLDGTTIDPAGTYRVTVNSFLAAGGDNFTVLGGGTNRTTPGDNDLTMLVDHFRANSPVTADAAKRSKVYEGGPAETGYEPFASWSALVRQQYVDFTGAAPDAFSEAVWVQWLTAGTKQPGDVVAFLAKVDVNSFEGTTLRYYDAFFRRPPAQASLNIWLDRFRRGATRKAAIAQFINTAEFRSRGFVKNSQFVDFLYREVLRRPADAATRTAWIDTLNRGIYDRGDVAVAFVEGNEGKAAYQPVQQGVAVYQKMLRRLPTAAEYAPMAAGLKSGTLTVAALGEAILASEAYATRVG